MAAQQRTQGGQVLGCFQRIKIVGALSEDDARGLKFFQSLTVTQSDATPIIALQQHERAIEVKSFDGKQAASALPKFLSESQHYASALGLRMTTISHPPSVSDPYCKIAPKTMRPIRGRAVSLFTRRVERATKEPAARFLRNCSL